MALKSDRFSFFFGLSFVIAMCSSNSHRYNLVWGADFVFFCVSVKRGFLRFCRELRLVMVTRVFWSVGIVEMLPRLVTAFVKCT